MKIVHLCLSCFYIDNYSYQENMLPKYHVLQEHDVTVIASLVSFNKQGKLCLLEEESNAICKDEYRVIRVDYKRPFYRFNKFVRRYKKLYRVIENECPDVIFIHDFSFLDIGEVLKYVKANREVKIFVDCHTDYINSAKGLISKYIFHHLIWRLYAKLLSPIVEQFYGVTPLRCDFLKNAYHINPDKISLLEMGVDDCLLKSKDRLRIREMLCEELDINPSNFIIATGGKIDKEKNIHLLIQAVRNIKKTDVKLVVFGTVVPEMKNEIESLIQHENIRYIGWLASDKILDYLLMSDLIVFPGTHSVLWEQAVGVGVPCLFKYWEGMTHVDVGGNCLFLYEDSCTEMENVLMKIVENEKLYSKMKNVALIDGLKKFSYSDIAKRSIKL